VSTHLSPEKEQKLNKVTSIVHTFKTKNKFTAIKVEINYILKTNLFTINITDAEAQQVCLKHTYRQMLKHNEHA
jgi:hypothetical protein